MCVCVYGCSVSLPSPSHGPDPFKCRSDQSLSHCGGRFQGLTAAEQKSEQTCVTLKDAGGEKCCQGEWLSDYKIQSDSVCLCYICKLCIYKFLVKCLKVNK